MITKDEALKKARRVGGEAYDDLDAYTVRIDEDVNHWKVAFSRPGVLERGGKQHFSVWVDKQTGETKLFRGR